MFAYQLLLDLAGDGKRDRVAGPQLSPYQPPPSLVIVDQHPCLPNGVTRF
jgi:hypothetical protein